MFCSRVTGFLFRAQPTLMTLESSATMMDAIFASDEWENRGRLLKLLQEFLLSEATKHAALEKGIATYDFELHQTESPSQRRSKTNQPESKSIWRN